MGYHTCGATEMKWCLVQFKTRCHGGKPCIETAGNATLPFSLAVSCMENTPEARLSFDPSYTISPPLFGSRTPPENIHGGITEARSAIPESTPATKQARQVPC